MKIRKVEVNNRKAEFRVVTYSGAVYPFPYAKTELPPESANKVADAYVDPELANEGFTYLLESGDEASVHLDQVLEYNKEPTYLRNLLIYQLTVEARRHVEHSRLSRRELARRLKTSLPQLYRLLDPTNTRKSINQLISLLQILDCDIHFHIATKAPDSKAPLREPENPYTAGGKRQLLQSLVVSADILGYRDYILNAHEPKDQAALLSRLRSAFDASHEHLYDLERYDKPANAFWATKTFTDNIAIGCPIFEDAESEMGIIFWNLAWLQYEFARRGLFLRGGLSIGLLYLDDELVFGKGLLEAYKAESEAARDPRIVLSESARQYVKMHMTYYARGPKASPHFQALLRDLDGQVFLDYLSCVITDFDPPNTQLLAAHKIAVEAKLDEYRVKPSVWRKYRWVAAYHNFICNELDAREHKIEIDELAYLPSRIDRDSL